MISIIVEKDEIGPMLEAMSQRASDWTQPMTKALESELEHARTVISGGGSGFGWAPLSPWTLKLDEVFGRPRAGMLHQTGALMESLTVQQVTPTEGSAGTDLDYGQWIQAGRGKTFKVLQSARIDRGYTLGGVSGRPFLFWHEEELDQYDEIFMAHLFDEGEGDA